MPRLDTIADIFGGYSFSSTELGDAGYPVVKIADIKPPVVSTDSSQRIQPPKSIGLDKYCLQDRDILMAMTGATTGKVGRYRSVEPAYLNQRVAKLSAKKGREFDDYVYAIVSQPGFEEKVLNNASGSAQPNVSADGIGRIEIVALPECDQLNVGRIIGALDDKIELNRKMSATLEAMARAIFTSWFVDFDPVRAKSAGRNTGLTPEIAALFSDSYDLSELGDIPTGWQVQAIGDLITRLGVGQKYEQKTVSKLGTVPVLDQGKSGFIGFHSNEPGIVASPKRRVVTFANHTCYMRLIDFPFSTIQNVLPFEGNNVETEWIYYATLDKQKSVEYKGHWPDFVRQRIVLPGEALCTAFSTVVQPLLERISLATVESQTLQSTRDALLPKLISGELRVEEAERILERSA